MMGNGLGGLDFDGDEFPAEFNEAAHLMLRPWETDTGQRGESQRPSDWVLALTLQPLWDRSWI